jgi:hypothetical protein
MLLGSLAHDGDVLELGGNLPKEVALAPVRLEEDEVEVRTGCGERDPRRATAGADVDHRPAGQQRSRRESAVEQSLARLDLVVNRGQARRGKQRRNPAVEPFFRQDE